MLSYCTFFLCVSQTFGFQKRAWFSLRRPIADVQQLRYDRMISLTIFSALRLILLPRLQPRLFLRRVVDIPQGRGERNTCFTGKRGPPRRILHCTYLSAKPETIVTTHNQDHKEKGFLHARPPTRLHVDVHATLTTVLYSSSLSDNRFRPVVLLRCFSHGNTVIACHLLRAFSRPQCGDRKGSFIA